MTFRLSVSYHMRYYFHIFTNKCVIVYQDKLERNTFFFKIRQTFFPFQLEYKFLQKSLFSFDGVCIQPIIYFNHLSTKSRSSFDSCLPACTFIDQSKNRILFSFSFSCLYSNAHFMKYA